MNLFVLGFGAAACIAAVVGESWQFYALNVALAALNIAHIFYKKR